MIPQLREHVDVVLDGVRGELSERVEVLEAEALGGPVFQRADVHGMLAGAALALLPCRHVDKRDQEVFGREHAVQLVAKQAFPHLVFVVEGVEGRAGHVELSGPVLVVDGATQQEDLLIAACILVEDGQLDAPLGEHARVGFEEVLRDLPAGLLEARLQKVDEVLGLIPVVLEGLHGRLAGLKLEHEHSPSARN